MHLLCYTHTAACKELNYRYYVCKFTLRDKTRETETDTDTVRLFFPFMQCTSIHSVRRNAMQWWCLPHFFLCGGVVSDRLL
jgi:hypothetical protein